MTIQFNTAVPWWTVLLLIAVACMFTVAVYRKHQLDAPWKIWLPLTRCLTVTLLVLMLKQPRFVKLEEDVDQGRVAVLVDNSGSMSIHDDYAPSKQVELAARLALFDPSLRNAEFAQGSDDLAEVNAHLARIQRRLLSLEQAMRRKNTLEFKKQSREIKGFYDEAGTLINAMPARLDNALKRHPYLSKVEPIVPIEPTESRVQGLTFKLWNDIPGWEVKDLTTSDRFQREPHLTRIVPSFDAIQNSGSNLGVVMNGFLHPPVSGNYVFQIASDDQGALFLSSDKSPEKKQQICLSRSWTPYKKYDVYPEQTSKPIFLEAHKVYYIEALMKENFGDDHLTVAWMRPDGVSESPIPGNHLTPYGARIADFIGPDFDRLFPRVKQLASQAADVMQQLQIEFSKLPEGDTGNLKQALTLHEKRVVKLAAEINDLQREMRKLQEAADLRLALSGNKDVDYALIRLKKMTRGDIAREVLTGRSIDLLNQIESKAKPALFVLGEEARVITSSELPVIKNRLNKTDLSGNIRDIFTYFENQYLAGVMVLTDGNDNGQSDLRELRKIALERDVPLIGISIGSTRPPRDISVESVIAPESSFKNDKTIVTAVIKRDGYTGESIAVAIRSNGQVLVEKIIPPGLESRISVELPFIETRSGSLEYSVSAQYFEGEQVKANNQQLFKMTTLKDPVKILLIDTFPRWETRFLSMLIQRDKRFVVDPFFIGHTPEEINALPIDDTLSSYEVLILGDVSPKQFTGDQIELIQTYVREENGCLFLIAGPNFMPTAYFNSPLRELLPISRGLEATEEPLRKRRGYTLQLTDDSSFDPMVRISNTPEISAKLWNGLPRMAWVQTGVTGSRSADTLVEATDKKLPVIIRSGNDIGRVVYLGSDSFWRWRDRVGWRYYHRFWGQLLLWAALDNGKSANPYVKIFATRPEINLGEPLQVSAQILDRNGQPLNETRATLDVFDLASGNIIKIVELNPMDDSEGSYTTSLKDLPPGKYRASPHVPELDGLEASAELRFEVRELPGTEFEELGLNRSNIKAFSTHVLEFENAQASLDIIQDVQVPRRTYREWSIWDIYPALIVICLLLTFEWIVRKRLQLP